MQTTENVRLQARESLSEIKRKTIAVGRLLGEAFNGSLALAAKRTRLLSFSLFDVSMAGSHQRPVLVIELALLQSWHCT